MESAHLPLRRNRNYELAWFGEAISGLGDIVFTTSVVLWVGAIIVKGHLAPAAVSGVLIAAMVDATTVTLAHPVVVEQREPEAETATESHSG
jgi:hypothetical protein